MSLLAQLFRHRDGAPADSDDVISLGAIVSALDRTLDEKIFAGAAVTPEVPPISTEPIRDVFASAEKTPVHPVESRPPDVAAIAATRRSIAPGDAAKAGPSVERPVILAAHGNVVGTAGKSPPIVHDPSHSAATAVAEHKGFTREAASFILRPLMGSVPVAASPSSAPVILAPLAMQTAHGALPPVFLVPAGCTPPETPKRKDDAAHSADKDEPHGTV